MLQQNTNNNNNKKIAHFIATGTLLSKATILFALTFSLKDSFRKYKIGHRSYSLCLGIRFILCSEYLYSDLSAIDLSDQHLLQLSILGSKKLKIPHWAQILPISNSKSLVLLILWLSSQQNHKLISERDHFFI